MTSAPTPIEICCVALLAHALLGEQVAATVRRHRARNDVYRVGYDAGYAAGYAAGRRVARPVVLPGGLRAES